jgi:signal transduction histidine kinase/DNA-binding response OmpR family regulator
VRIHTYLEGLVAGNLEPGERIRFYAASGNSLFAYPDEDILTEAVEAEWERIRRSGASRGSFALSVARGQERFIAFQTVPSLFGPAPLVSVTFSASSAAVYARADARFHLNLVLLLLAACLALGIVQALGGRLVAAPVKALIRTARGLRLGDFSARPPVSNPVSELGQLATTFDEMAASLERRDQEMVRAKIASDEDNQAKGEFLANMSHEIRTPLNAVIGLAYLALKSPLSDKQRHYCSEIYAAANTLQGIVNDILDFSKIEAGELAIDNVVFSLEEVLDTVGVVIGQKANDRDLEILFQIGGTVPASLAGDPLRLNQILTNIGSNAVKFTTQGTIIIACEVDDGSPLPSSVPGAEPVLPERPGPDQVCLRFSVADTGIGIAEEQQDRLFEAFTQADGSTTRNFGGTGLGLTITRRLLDLMRGRIAVRSAPGQGAVFTFTACFGRVPEERSPEEFPRHPRKERLLVVDDNPAALKILRDMLARLAFTAEAASTAKEAFALLRKAEKDDRPYQLAFLDWSLPDMDGAEATRIILNSLGLASPPRIIFVAAFGRDDITARAEQAGAVSILYKPVSRSLLLVSLGEILAGSQETPLASAREDDSLRAESPPPESAEIPGAPAAAEQGASLAGIRILVVEDNPINQQIAEEILQDAGAEVVVAENGRRALEKLEDPRSAPFHLVLMDMQMPEMDGSEATRRIRAQARFDGLPVIAMTAHAMVEEQQHCLALGMNDYIAKPIDVDVFFLTLARWLPSSPQNSPGPVREGSAVGFSAKREKSGEKL